MQNLSNEKWRTQAVSPNNKLKTTRSMPQWLQARGSGLPPPPPPPIQADLSNHADPDYEVIEFSNNQAYINAPTIMDHGKGKEGRRCDLCGSSAPSVKCDKCAQQNFCYSCDDMYHRHPKRQSHIRKPLEPSKANFRPPLPPKGENSSAPVPPPRRNKRMSRTSTPGPVEQGFKKDGSLMGSLRRMMGTRPLPPTPTLISRDTRQEKLMELQDQPPSRDSGYLDWELDSRHRSGSLTALNSPNFAPLMHAQSMAQLSCPSCQHHGMVWDWNHQHMAGGFNRPWNALPTGTWHGSAMIPQLRQESSADVFRRNSLRPRRSRRDLVSDMSGEEDETFFRRRHTSPARSRRGMVSDFDDSDEDDIVSHRSGRRSRGRRGSPSRNVSPALSRKSSGRKLSVEEMINQRMRKNDDEGFSPRGRNYDDHDTVSLRGGGRRTDDEVSSNRGGRRQLDDEVMSNHGRRRYDDDVLSQRGGRRSSNVLDDAHSNRGARRNSEVRKRRNKSPEKNHAPPIINRSREEASSEDSGDELSDENRQLPDVRSKEKSFEVEEKEVEKSAESVNGKEPEEPLGPIPTQQWECTHCTFVNRAGTRVCTVCCKTTSNPKYIEERKKTSEVRGKSFPKQKSLTDVDLVKNMAELAVNTDPQNENKEAVEETEEEKRRKKKGPAHDIPDVKKKVVASTGTSPPPQSISTQTYDVLRPKLRRAASLADHDLWTTPQRSASRQSLTSDSQSLPLTPSRSQSPGAESLPSWGDMHLKRERDMLTREQLWGDLQSENGSVRNQFQMARRPSEPALNSRAVVRRADSQPTEYFNTLVQKQMKQGLEMVKLLREAEDNQFNADELGIALNQCGEGNPVSWLINNWRNMIDTVVTLATNYGHERKENTVGTISVSEAKDALIMHNGNVWAAVTECIEQRQKKYADLMSRGNFTREDIVTVLTANHGNLESAFLELNKNQLKPFLMRIWGPPQGTDNESGNVLGLQQPDGSEFGDKAKPFEKQPLQTLNAPDEVSDGSNSNEAPRYSQVKSWLGTTLNDDRSDKENERMDMNVLEQQLRKVSLPGEAYVGTMLLKSTPQKPTNQQLIELAKQQNKWKSESQLLHYYDNEEFISNRKRKKKLREEKSKTVYTDSFRDKSVIERLIIDGDIDRISGHLEDQYSFEGEIHDVGSLSNDKTNTVYETLRNEVAVEMLGDKHQAFVNIDRTTNQLNPNTDVPTVSGTLRGGRVGEIISNKDLAFENLDVISKQLDVDNGVPGNIAVNEVLSKSTKNSLSTDSRSQTSTDESSVIMQTINNSRLTESPFSNLSNIPSSSSYESFDRSEDERIKPIENRKEIETLDSIIIPEIVTSSKLIVALDRNTLDKIKLDKKISDLTENNDASKDLQQVEHQSNLRESVAIKKQNNPQAMKISTIQIQINSENNTNSGKTVLIKKEYELNNSYLAKTNLEQNYSNKTNTDEKTVLGHSDSDVDKEMGHSSNEPTREKYFEDIFVRTVNSSENESKTTDNEDEDTEEFVDTLQSPIEEILEDLNESIDDVEDLIIPDLNTNQSIVLSQEELKKDGLIEEHLSKSLNVDDSKQLSSPSTPISERLLDSFSSNSSQKTSSSMGESRAEILDLLKASLSDDQVLDRIVSSLFANVLVERSPSIENSILKDRMVEANSITGVPKSVLPTKRLSLSSESEINAESEFFEAEEEVESVPIPSVLNAQDAPLTSDVPGSDISISKSVHESLNNTADRKSPRPTPFESQIPNTRDVPLERLKDIVENTVVFKESSFTSPPKHGSEISSNIEILNQGTRTGPTELNVSNGNISGSGESDREVGENKERIMKEEEEIEELAEEEEEGYDDDEEEEIEEDEEEEEEEIEDEEERKVVYVKREGKGNNNEDSITNNVQETKEKNIEIQEAANKVNVNSTKDIDEGISNNGEVAENYNSKMSDSSIPNDSNLMRERQARRYLAEGHVETYDQAELAVQLMELEFDQELSLSTAKECSSLASALSLLQQECQLCAEKYTMKQMISMLECEHFCCQGCAIHYFTLQITERSINDCVCPFCKQPDLHSYDGDQALNYFSNLDIQLKGFLEPAIHELFQRKLRDRTLMQDPNFKWCAKCSSGFIANPRQKRLVCPDCRSITCASCRRPWEKQHEGVSCTEYAVWLEKNNPENEIDQHLAEHGVTCPKCMARYSLSRGGCMHLTCPHCKHEFCSGCANPFLMGMKCNVSDYCAKLGLHAHHPRNCLFYLRDKEPQLLQKLLDDNNVQYKKDLPEKEGARCTMQLQRETPEGMIDVVCSQPVIFSGLCRTHYIEYLVKQIGQQKLDPVAILDLAEAQQELRRRGKPLPDRASHLSDHDYLKLCAKVVKEEIPLE